ICTRTITTRSWRQRRGWKHRRPRFEERLRPLRKTVLALLKLGFDLPVIMAMPEAEAVGYLESYNRIMSPESKKTYVVKPKRGK
ncbi:MAG: hypothetical protein P4L42_06540, partial [Desulfocapsaceae bacterium]|nr:hypothetical protein [Desulfocapsaceae bacterium]